jgi:hypothetical protein
MVRRHMPVSSLDELSRRQRLKARYTSVIAHTIIVASIYMVLGLVGIVQYVGRLRELIARKERVLVAVNEAILPSAMGDAALGGTVPLNAKNAASAAAAKANVDPHVMHDPT